ncbi:DUF1611 domain-containing protein [Maricaulis sp.]|uniref:DUF1611 domain-containing protein n=1 Tax=Maricaulis sp. TaxID=1486257 RepID=UPI002617D685|nr:DUF1611 domain-containing protein [Maricaulis sp.]
MSLASRNEDVHSLPARESGPCTVQLRSPYLIYFGNVPDAGHAKTGLGLIQWRRENCAGQFRSAGCQVDGGLADMSIADAAASGVGSLVIGVASEGGSIPDAWVGDLAEAARAGLDLVSGMHVRLSDFPEIAAAARASGARLIDVRTPPRKLPVGSGEKRPGRRILTVGTDCAVGKKYTALAIEREMRARGLNADFRATGQTGIMIAGSGIPMDCVVSDFLSGAAELLSPAAPDDHWDVIEGQGALSHPSFAGVSLGLLHGSQPDALVLCHDPLREVLLGTGGASHFPVIPVRDAMEQCVTFARRVNPAARFVGLSINTSMLSDTERQALLDRYERETGLPAVDPIKDGAGLIVDKILSRTGV